VKSIDFTAKMPTIAASRHMLVRSWTKNEQLWCNKRGFTVENVTDNTIRNRAGRAISDLVMAELFLVQATIESASALGDGFSELRDHLYWDEAEGTPREELSAFLKRTREQVVEPYSTRFKYLRELVKDQHAA
jgi:hypothetical protein